MLDYSILRNKSTVKGKDNEEYVDLLSVSFDKNIVPKGSFIMVNKHYVARPDLISLAVYQDDKYADVICKINGISNPFELNENDLVFIPTLDYLREFIVNNKSKISSDMITSDDEEIMVKNTVYQKTVDEKRSPNQQLVGESNYILDKSMGIIFY